MEFDAQTLIAMFGLAGAAILGGTLLGGPTERTGLPALAVFLLLGLILSPYGLGLFTVTLDDPMLRTVATLGLTLVLFTDAMTLDLQEVRRNKALATLLLGPGTLLAALGLGLVAWQLLALPLTAALVLGAAVASTDPVVLRGMLQGSGLPERLRLALRLESGMNDVLLLPIVAIALAFGAQVGAPSAVELVRLLLSLFVLGPLAGVVVGVGAVQLLVWVRDRFGVRREYESLYVIGVALAAFSAAEAVGGSGFLAAFSAGIVVSSLDVELCDCFLEYGQVTAEMALLFTFVLLGTGPIWSGMSILGPAPLLFALIALLVRLPIFAVAMGPLRLPMRERLTLGWYGPRGLGTLLLALLAVFAGLPQGEQIVALASLVVLLSIAFQGGWPLLRRRHRRRAAPVPQGLESASALSGARLGPQTTLPDRITVEQLHALQADLQPGPAGAAAPDVKSGGTRFPRTPAFPAAGCGGAAWTPDARSQCEPGVCAIDEQADGAASEHGLDGEPAAVCRRPSVVPAEDELSAGAPVVIIDVRSERSYTASDQIAASALRIPPDRAVAALRAFGVPANAWVVAYCT